MIPKLSELLVLQSKRDWNQAQKNKWLIDRNTADNYYKGRTEQYTEGYFDPETLVKIATANVNITKRIIDRISLVYMVGPKRSVGNDRYFDYTRGKDLKLQRAEKKTNLLDVIAIKPTFRNNNIDLDIIQDFEPMFDDDPLTPYAIHYPLKARSTVMDTTPEKWAYWDAENHFVYDKNGKIYSDESNPDMVNPYGILPFVFTFRDGKPESEFMDTDVTTDMIQTNLMINLAETNKNANIHFQSFGYLYITGAESTQGFKVSPEQATELPEGATMGFAVPPNTVDAVTNSINESYKMLAQNYHLNISFVEGTTAESGVALRLRNQELNDDRRSDVERARDMEEELYKIEREILKVDAKFDPGEWGGVDFSESVEVLTPQEQREQDEWGLSKGLISLVDIVMRENPDFEEAEAIEYLAKRKAQPNQIARNADTEDNIFLS